MNNVTKTAIELDRILKEYCDGFLCIGFHPENQEPMLVLEAKTKKECIALNGMLSSILHSGGVEVVRNQIESRKKKR